MPHPKHPSEPIQTDDGQELDQDEILDDAEEEAEVNPNLAAKEFEEAGADPEEID